MAHPQPSRPVLNVALAGAGMISWHHLIAWRNARRARPTWSPSAIPTRARPQRAPPSSASPRSAGRAEEIVRRGGDRRARHRLAARDPCRLDRGRGRPRRSTSSARSRSTPTLAEGEALLGRRGRQGPPHGARELALPALVPRRSALARRAASSASSCRPTCACISSGLLPDASGRRAGPGAPALHGPRAAADDRRGADPSPRRGALPVRPAAGGRGPRRRIRCPKSSARRSPPSSSRPPPAARGRHRHDGRPRLSPRAQDRLEIVGSKASAVLDAEELQLLGPTPRSAALRLRRGLPGELRRRDPPFRRLPGRAAPPSRPMPPTISRRCGWSRMPMPRPPRDPPRAG